MDKLNRLVWADGLAISTYGLRIGLRANDEGDLPRLIQHLPPVWHISDSPIVDRLYSLWIGTRGTGDITRRGIRPFHLLYTDWTRTARTNDLEALFEAVETEIQLYVAEMTPQYVFVHAGVVAWRGHAIVIPGRSFSGKTSLVAALVRAGATYYSDEYAVLDHDGLVHPYSRPLSVRIAGQAKPTRRRVEEFGGRAGTESVPIGLVIATHYRPGARWCPRRLSAGQGVLALLEQTVSAQHAPHTALVTLRRGVGAATIFQGARGEADHLADILLQQLER